MNKDPLKESPSEVLLYYPAVIGWLAHKEEHPEGLQVVEARASITLDQRLASATYEEEMELAYCEPMGADHSIWSPYYVQLTEFCDKAVAIGMTCPHMHADPTCTILHVRAWFDTHRRAYIVYPSFTLRPSSPSPTPIPALPSSPPNSSSSSLPTQRKEGWPPPPSSSLTPLSSPALPTPASPLPLHTLATLL
ncbi:protein ECERIFERUM 26-like [Canna indica]|uniref:Protein ECERIFERUM 26-like n=1 Tax=Canna indica TaxID=4628 RepID=A0AAQ3QC45_9LILI|nr:protein ECERIFERUM 26-like [Canna indica]